MTWHTRQKVLQNESVVALLLGWLPFLTLVQRLFEDGALFLALSGRRSEDGSLVAMMGSWGFEGVWSSSLHWYHYSIRTCCSLSLDEQVLLLAIIRKLLVSFMISLLSSSIWLAYQKQSGSAVVFTRLQQIKLSHLLSWPVTLFQTSSAPYSIVYTLPHSMQFTKRSVLRMQRMFY